MRDDTTDTHDTQRPEQPEPPADPPPSEFRCPGCGTPLYITLRSDFCLAEAQVFCPACERDYQERRGRWAPDAGA